MTLKLDPKPYIEVLERARTLFDEGDIESASVAVDLAREMREGVWYAQSEQRGAVMRDLVHLTEEEEGYGPDSLCVSSSEAETLKAITWLDSQLDASWCMIDDRFQVAVDDIVVRGGTPSEAIRAAWRMRHGE